MTLLRINGTDYTGYLKASGGYAIKRNDVDGENSGRVTMDALMYRDRRAVKTELTLACRPLTGAEARKLLNDIYPEFVTVDYYDPRSGMVYGAQMYSNNVPAEFLFRKPDGTEWWDGIKFPLIER
ncbi:MAG: hypothetical protein U0N82_01090 [Oscillospiraceae bacterium]